MTTLATMAAGLLTVRRRGAGPQTIEDRLRDARRRLRRVTPAEAFAAVRDGAVLVDIRPEPDRRDEGVVPQALVIERNVLEWRFDPACADRLPIADYDLRVVILCNEGYTSSLAAEALQELGIRHATDVIGGYRAWRAAGLPVRLSEAGHVGIAPAR